MKWSNVLYKHMKFNQRIQQTSKTLLQICMHYQESVITESSQTRWFIIELSSVFETILWQNVYRFNAWQSYHHCTARWNAKEAATYSKNLATVSIENVDTKKWPPTKRGSNPVPRPPRQRDIRKAQQCSCCEVASSSKSPLLGCVSKVLQERTFPSNALHRKNCGNNHQGDQGWHISWNSECKCRHNQLNRITNLNPNDIQYNLK